MDGTLKAGLVEGVDFVALPKRVWRVLHFRYSGAPVFPRVLLRVDVEGDGEGGGAGASGGVDGEGDAEDEFVIRSRGVGDGEYTNGYGGVTKSPDVHTYTSKDETKLQIERYPLTIRYRFHRH